MLVLKQVKQKIRGFILTKSNLGAEFVWVLLAQVATLVGGLLTIKLLSNMLTQAEFGVYALLFSVPSLLVSMLFTPAGQINMRFLVLAQEQGRISCFYHDQKVILGVFSVLSLLLLIPCVFFLHEHISSFIWVYSALALLTLIIGYQTAQQFLLMAFRLRTEASIVQLIGAISRPLAVFIFLWLWGYDAFIAILGLSAGFAILAFSQYLYLQSSWNKALFEPQTNEAILNDSKHPKDTQKISVNELNLTMKNYLSYGSFHVVLGLVTVIVLNADRWILSAVGTLEQVAIYASLMQISLAPTAFSFAVLTRMAAPLYYKSKTQPRAVQDRYFMILLLLWGGLCVGILLFSILFHHSIVVLITNKTFAQYSYLLPWMILGLILERTAQVFEMKGALFLKTHIYAMPRLILIAIIPLSEYLCWRLYGFDWLVIGLIAATTLSLGSIIMLNHIYLRK